MSGAYIACITSKFLPWLHNSTNWLATVLRLMVSSFRKELFVVHIRFNRMHCTGTIKAEAWRRIYWTPLSVDTTESGSLCRGSAERERKSLHARIEKVDLELSISDGHRLSHQLIQPLYGNRAIALVVYAGDIRLCPSNLLLGMEGTIE
jgi:hypothetical protein